MIRNKHLSIFDNERDFNSELASGNLKKPHVSLIKGASKVCYEALPKPKTGVQSQSCSSNDQSALLNWYNL